MKSKATLTRLALLAALAATLAPAHALTLFWGGSVWSEDLESDGSTMLTSGDFTFQIGAFDVGFDPATAEVDTWAAAWHIFDETPYDDTNMFFDGKADMDANGISNGTNADTSFDFRNQQLYIWVYDDNTYDTPLSSDECHEWALVTGDTWTLTGGGDQTTLPAEFRLDNATDAVTGALGTLSTGSSEILGTIGTATAPSVAYDLQTYKVCAIPEPSGALLAALGTGALLLRRKRA